MESVAASVNDEMVDRSQRKDYIAAIVSLWHYLHEASAEGTMSKNNRELDQCWVFCALKNLQCFMSASLEDRLMQGSAGYNPNS